MDDELELSPDSNDMLMIDEDCEGDAETDQSDLNMELLNDEVGRGSILLEKRKKVYS